MKRLLATALLVLSATSAFAQICEVDMVDRYNRVIKTFRAYGDANSCVEGMKECRKEIALNRYSQGENCIRRSYQQPGPQYPGQGPHYPNPYPPTQHGYGIEVNRLAIDLMNSTYSHEVKTKIAETLITNMSLYQLRNVVNLCASSRNWNENASCLSTSIQRAPIEIADEYSAQRAVGRACSTSTKTNIDEQNCFKAAERHFPNLNYLTQACRANYNVQRSIDCYRQVFGR